jgi:hypothetical protein
MANPPKTRRSPSIIESSKYAPGQPPVDDRRRRLEALGQDRAAIAHAKQEIAQISRQQSGRASAQVQLDDVEVQERKPRQMVVVPAPLPPQPVEMHGSLGDTATTDQQAINDHFTQRPGASEQKKAQSSGGTRPSRATFERTEHPPVRSAAPARSMPIAQGAVYPRDERYTVPPPTHDVYQSWEMFGPPARGQFFVLLLVSLACLAVIWMFLQSPKTFISSYNGSGLGNAVSNIVSKAFGGEGQSPFFRQLSMVDVPEGEHSILGQPSITVDQIEAVLTQYNSPARGSGKIWFELGKQYGIDPAYPLAFFIQESTAGTNAGWAGLKSGGGTTHNVGNIICAGYATCYKGNRDYPSWESGIDDWYRLIAREYVEGRGLASVEQILPIYCPVSDGCRSYDYISIVNSMVEKWHQGQLFQ